ncbi:MAG: flagellar protein FlaG [Deltaproteobacteria bacterium]|nr:flagellar protein FlaG [Deltaproteobacteria bacterium]
MDAKGDIVLPVSPVVFAGPSGHAEAGKPASPPPPVGKGTGLRPPDYAELHKVVREALNIESLPNRELRIEFENDLHRVVVKVLDKETGEVIRQIPMPESLAIAKHIRAQLGRMVREQRAVAVDQEV